MAADQQGPVSVSPQPQQPEHHQNQKFFPCSSPDVGRSVETTQAQLVTARSLPLVEEDTKFAAYHPSQARTTSYKAVMAVFENLMPGGVVVNAIVVY